MFGYIRPVQSELKVKDAELYKALYCGLCRVMKKEVSSVLPLSISYDYVLLAAVRAGLSGETFWAEHQICPYKPYRRKKMARPVKALSDTAITALILTKYNLDDKLADGDISRFKKLFLCIYRNWIARALKRKIKKDNSGTLAGVCGKVEEKLSVLHEMERAGETSADRPAVCSGEVLEAAVAFGLEPEAEEKLRLIARDIGSFIYWLDAVDDLEKDEKSGAYNPLLLQYHTAKEARKEAKLLDMIMAQYTARMAKLAQTIQFGQTSKIVENIFHLGLGVTSRRVLAGEKGAKHERSV